MDYWMEKFKNKLSENNYKLTRQRQDILQIFIENRQEHFNAEELYDKVKIINREVGLATIYRTLEILNDLNIIHQLDFNKNYKRYELNIADNHHHHLICIGCNRIIEFNDRVLENFEEQLEEEYDFEIVNHRIKFYGICRNCSREND